MENSCASLTNSNFNKLEKFDREHLQIWKRNVSLNLQYVDVDHVLSKDEPKVLENGTVNAIAAATTKNSKWKR